MFDIAPLQIAIVLLIALLVFGPRRLPELGRGLGSGIRDFKEGLTGAHPAASRLREDAAGGDVPAAAPDPPDAGAATG